MRVAVIVSTFPPYRGGMGNAAAQQAELLAAAGHDVTVFTPRAGKTPPHEKKYKVERLRPLVRFGNAAWLPQLRFKLSSFDVVFLHYPFFGGVEFFSLWKLPVPLVLFYHMDAVGKGVWKKVFSFHHDLFLKRLLHHSDLVLASSESYAKASRLEPLLAELGDRFSPLPFSIDTKFFHPAPKPQDLLNRHRLDAKRPIALSVATLDSAHYFKGIEVLLRAWQKVLKALPSAKLFIVGDGNLRSYYVSLATGLGIDRGVTFVGACSDEELREYYHLADIVVVPSIDRSEAFGLVALEAMASGRPVVASDLPGVSSLVQNNETGRLVPPDDMDTLARVLEETFRHDEMRRMMGERAREVVLRQYDNDVIKKHLDDIVRRVTRV
jgi:glycosyltransferase involved in cell wall biosynthesis